MGGSLADSRNRAASRTLYVGPKIYSAVYWVPGRVPVTGRQACLPEYSGTGQNDSCTTGCPVFFSLFLGYLLANLGP
jgi:hypothetical protein